MIEVIANIVVPVADQERAITFYRDILGFELRADFAMGPGVRWVELSPPGAATTIALAAPRGDMWSSVGGETNISLGCSQIVEEHLRLRALAVDVDEQILDLGETVPKMFRLRDPDGNVLQLVEN
jgi:catechol 2,3-dioxygenase-like lactoylglutathione lyase family enzyme